MTKKVNSLSIIIPVYNEEKSVKPLFKEISQSLKATRLSRYEVIFVDDGSTDNTLKNLEKIKNKNLKLVCFRKNFGKGYALKAGVDHSQYPHFFTLDGDLQDDPRELPKLIKKMEGGNDLVVGWKYHRQDPLVKIIISRIANFIISLFIRSPMHDMNSGFKLIKKEVVENIPLQAGLYRFMVPLAIRRGHRVAEVRVNHRKRKYGRSKFGWRQIVFAGFDFINVIFLSKYLNGSFPRSKKKYFQKK